ncbi:Uncharacterised protein [Mycobacteroides abscessus subsp. bolletii]|nr:Uncharacterised protein [Mycobacteroides abscessus subsp. bolletii]
MLAQRRPGVCLGELGIQLVSASVDRGHDVGAELVFGAGFNGIAVVAGGGCEPQERVLRITLGAGRRVLRAVATQDFGEDFDSGLWQQCAAADDLVGIVFGGGKVDVVTQLAARHRHIQQLAGQGGCADEVAAHRG